MAETVSNAVATRDQESKMDSFLEQYQPRFAEVLPAHVKPETFMRLATGAFRKNDKLLDAARSDPASLVNALSEAARKGLEPGTEQFYLVPRRIKGRATVQGLEGYQGIVERMYRAGYVASVVVQVVRENDKFNYDPGVQEKPLHTVDWFGDRGPLIGVYAYANMREGAVSQVVVMNKQQVMEVKAKSDGANSEYSPWQQWEEAMWLKTAARRLEKWIPTSAEIRSTATQPAVVEATVLDRDEDDDSALHYEPEDGE